MNSHITSAKVAEAVNHLHSGITPEVDVIRREFFKALDVSGLSWLTRFCNIAVTLGTVSLKWQTGVVVPEGVIFQDGGVDGHSRPSLLCTILPYYLSISCQIHSDSVTCILVNLIFCFFILNYF